MKKAVLLFTGIWAMLIFSSCQNKTIELLSKKWDCVKVENLDTPVKGFESPEDSINTVRLHSVLESLSWTFTNTMQYECAVAGRVSVRGSYELTDDEKVLICTPNTRNTVNRYTINTLTEYDLVLRSTSNTPLVLHFKSQ